MREKILTFIEKNSRIDTQELAVILGVDETAVMNELEAMEQEGIICGYHTLINWDKAGVEKVTALIEVRVTPQRGMGFDKVAERIYNYPEVNSVYLISGGFDLMVTLEGKTLREISQFVSDKLSALDQVAHTDDQHDNVNNKRPDQSKCLTHVISQTSADDAATGMPFCTICICVKWMDPVVSIHGQSHKCT